MLHNLNASSRCAVGVKHCSRLESSGYIKLCPRCPSPFGDSIVVNTVAGIWSLVNFKATRITWYQPRGFERWEFDVEDVHLLRHLCDILNGLQDRKTAPSEFSHGSGRKRPPNLPKLIINFLRFENHVFIDPSIRNKFMLPLWRFIFG